MLLLPIIEREMRVASRGWKLFFSRSVSAGIGLFFLFYFLAVFRFALGGGMTGWLLLRFMTTLTLGIAVFGSLMRTVDSLSSEKRADTLGLLFLTRLRSIDIIGGKLASGGASSLMLLLAIFPVFSVATLLGGISGGDLVRLPLACLNAAFFSLALGLLVSSLVTSSRAAGTGAALCLVCIMGMPSFGRWVANELETPALELFFTLPTPAYSLELAMAGPKFATNSFVAALAIQLLLAAGFLWLAAVALDRSRQTKPKATISFRFLSAVQSWSAGSEPSRKAWRARLLDLNPMTWLSFRHPFARWVPPFVFSSAIALAGAIILKNNLNYEEQMLTAFFALGVVEFYLKGRVATVAAEQLGKDRQSGALEMILATPLSVGEIIRGQLMAIRKQTGATYALFLALLLICGLTAIRLLQTEASRIWVLLLIATFLAADYFILPYVAMWKAMRLSNPAQAPSLALIRVGVLPWILYSLALIATSWSDTIQSWKTALEPAFNYTLPVAVWLLSNGSAFLFARTKLLSHFREAATDQYSNKQPWFFFS